MLIYPVKRLTKYRFTDDKLEQPKSVSHEHGYEILVLMLLGNVLDDLIVFDVLNKCASSHNTLDCNNRFLLLSYVEVTVLNIVHPPACTYICLGANLCLFNASFVSCET